MFYARPNYNMAGEILFGLPKIHVLNRYRGTSPTPRSPQPPSVTPSPDIDPIILSAAGSAASGDTNRDATAEHILKYIFPRHFGLENMFVGAAALSPEASSRFVRPKEFLLRTQEIQASKNPIKIHWRMRAIKPLVQRMQMLHSRCQYKNLLMFYCPVKGCNNTVENNWRITRSDTEVDGMQQADASWNGDQNRTNSNDAEILMEVENIANKQHVETDGRVPEADQGNALEPLDDEISPNPIALFSSYHQVSSFVQAILKLVIPRDFWGSDSNRKLTFNAVDRFVRMRKFETISLHEILQGFKVNDCLWLRPRDVSYTDIHSRVQPDTDATVKLTPTSRKAHVRPEEAQKRREMLMEFIYWLFDSFVVPLIKTNFYVTESSPHRNRIFYFRHDLWVKISKPVLDRLMADNFQEVASEEVSSILSQRKLGHSYIRLLPKETGVRPIINLRRKTIMNTSKFNNKSSTPSPWVGSSINMILQNSFHILTFEKSEHPEALGGSVLGMNEIYQRFKTFKQHIYNTSKANEPLYFAKVDITHCFDSIDQAKLLDILQSVVENDEYLLQRYAIMFPSSGKIRKAYIRKAHPTTKFREFPELAHELAQLLRQTVFVDHVVYIYEDRKAVLELLDEHIRMNFVKVGEQYYKQVIGLPQGSCLSMLLCNYFYGDLEKTKLSFVASDTNGMLLRFVDDFLYVSLSKDLVTRFLKAMYKGHPSYGCFINKDKSLVNFDIAIDGIGVPRLEKSLDFPWCGLLLHTKTLDVKADYSRYRGAYVNDAITTENSRHPGEALVHKMMQMLKPKCHPIYINTALNSIFTVLRNIYQNFLLCAMKFHCHARSLPHQDQKFLTGAVFDILNFGYTLLRNRVVSPMSKSFQLECNVKELEVLWLGAHAFFIVLLKKQTSYPIVLRTLEKTLLDKRFNPFRKKLAAVVDRRLSKDFEDILF
ncbi:hypothetical protein BC936DRAFT_146596 [Jimgerdemannia flammicorona]|uniref:Telomerase reverse transcriptase n=1 Tax=Jimgerdemannia flammicorona TaxID=994334 RepID=A0A433D7X3_9FUNG|nr:hypothetical protein BC936DRAFT_146596 [Jimgerdemannia flammicorona]